MLFLAAAIIFASVHLGGVAGAPALTAEPATTGDLGRSAADVEASPHGVTVSPPIRDGRVEPDFDGCRGAGASTFSAEACLDQLARASSSGAERFAATLDADGDDATSLAAAVGEQVSPEVTATWWSDLEDERRRVLAQALPGVVGNLEGLPYAVRDTANRQSLRYATTAVADRIGSDAERADDPRRLAMLQQVRATLDGATHDVPFAGTADRHLVALDTALPGRAAVTVGDLDTADDVSVLVPGMLFTVSDQLVDWTNTAGALHDEQATWATLLGRGGPGPVPTVAVVAWMGYQTPDLTNFYDLGLAHRGADHLEDALAGLDAARPADEPRVSVMAHSYGSTTATIALSSGRVAVDSLVLLGSPGSVVTEAGDLAVRGDDVYAAAGSFDPVAGSGFFGADPATAAFGAVVLHMGGGSDTVTGRALDAALGHNDYFRAGTESMRSLALIGLGHGDLVDGRAGDPGGGGPEAPALTLVRPQDVYFRD
ncbi:alpha/beta hydrolase [Frigoribacterium sp. PhB24]|uniref:alpha/beta hydrolase n=1 Tax=Frigoribacterium sp. PhB24 TaxID=2485204 RepID=UPI000F4AD4C6|nr:alpha/beta hydrolase [Frigoribacterium sp. PhB24]ROS51617.1 alpha/beta hydrolase family protein [Frigoribacterium sp. PhB24]